MVRNPSDTDTKLVLGDRRVTNKVYDFLIPLLVGSIGSAVSAYMALQVAVTKIESETSTKFVYVEKDIAKFNLLVDQITANTTKLALRETWMKRVDEDRDKLFIEQQKISDSLNEAKFELKLIHNEIERIRKREEYLKNK